MIRKVAKSMIENAKNYLIKSPQRAQSSIITIYKKSATSRLRTWMMQIARILTDPCASALSAQSVFYCTPSAFICVHLRLTFVSLSDIIQDIQIKLFPIICKKIIELTYDYQTRSCLNLLEKQTIYSFSFSKSEEW